MQFLPLISLLVATAAASPINFTPILATPTPVAFSTPAAVPTPTYAGAATPNYAATPDAATSVPSPAGPDEGKPPTCVTSCGGCNEYCADLDGHFTGTCNASKIHPGCYACACLI